MSDSVLAHQPSPSRECGAEAGYSACFYPGFVRRLAVRQPGGAEVVLYEQSGRFYLPAGAATPWPCSEVEFTRPDRRKIRLQIDDPHTQIARIEVVFKADGGGTDGGAEEGEGESLVIWESPVTCPPNC